MNPRANPLAWWAVRAILLVAILLVGLPGGEAAPQAVLYDQTDNATAGYIGSTNFLNNVSYDSLDSQGADDFQVPPDKIWQLSTATVLGLYTGSTGSSVVESVLVQIYSNSAGNLPATLMYSATVAGAQITGLATGLFVMPLSSPVSLGPGRYWLSVQANKQVDGVDGYQWHWRERSTQTLSPSAWRNPGGGYGPQCPTFQRRILDCLHPGTSTNPDLLFKLEGTAIDITNQMFLPIIRR